MTIKAYVDYHPVYVDHVRPANWRYRKSCHMFVDVGTDLSALHYLATLIGLDCKHFQHQFGKCPHYDLTENKRKQAIKAGAIPVDRRDAGLVFRRWRKHHFLSE